MSSEELHPSVHNLWTAFQAKNPSYLNAALPISYYFCDNEIAANDCANLVVKGIKQATSPSLWYFEKHQEPLPQKGDLAIVTNWNGIAKAIIQTTKVEQVPYNKITPAYAAIEGEGDKSLDYWKKGHWEYYTNEMKPYKEAPWEAMIIVCEYFETIWTIEDMNCKTSMEWFGI